MSSLNKSTVVSESQPSLVRLVFASHMLLATTILILSACLVGWQKYRSTYDKVESELLGAAELLNEKLAAGVSLESLGISEAFFHRFGKADRDHAYWRLWDKDGHIVASRGNVLPTVARLKISLTVISNVRTFCMPMVVILIYICRPPMVVR